MTKICIWFFSLCKLICTMLLVKKS